MLCWVVASVAVSHHSEPRSTAPGSPPGAPVGAGGTDASAILNMHDVLSCPRRRIVLHLLQEAGGSLAMDELAERALALDVAPSLVSAHREGVPVRSWLYHEHVLEMAAFGIVEYDHDDDVVSVSADFAVSVPAPE